MLTQFRTRYPHGSLISELITIDRGQYVVKVMLQVDGIILSTGLAAAERVETAEDRARERALLALDLDNNTQPTDAAVTITNHVDSVIARSSPEKPTPSKQLPTTAKEEEQIKPLTVNTPPVASTITPVATIDSGVNNHLTESSHPPQSRVSSVQEIDQTDFKSSADDLSPSVVPSAKPEPLDTPIPEVSTTQTLETVEFDFNEIKNRTDVEIKRLGWTKEQGRDFLLQTYGKRSRLHLTDQELMDFLYYLESQPNPDRVT